MSGGFKRHILSVLRACKRQRWDAARMLRIGEVLGDVDLSLWDLGEVYTEGDTVYVGAERATYEVVR